MINVFMVGSLGKRFRPKWELDVSSPQEALHAMNINTNGTLYLYLNGPAKDKFFKIALKSKKNLISEEELIVRSGDCDIYIMPTIAGKNSGVGKIIAGVVLAFVAVALLATPLAFLAPLVGHFADALVFGGVVQLITAALTSKPKTQAAAEAEKNSSVFAGNASAVSQGDSVPLIYGRVLVSPTPISVALDSFDQTTTPAPLVDPTDPIQNIDPIQNDLIGGGLEYVRTYA